MCFTKDRKSYRSGVIWGWENDNRMNFPSNGLCWQITYAFIHIYTEVHRNCISQEKKPAISCCPCDKVNWEHLIQNPIHKTDTFYKLVHLTWLVKQSFPQIHFLLCPQMLICYIIYTTTNVFKQNSLHISMHKTRSLMHMQTFTMPFYPAFRNIKDLCRHIVRMSTLKGCSICYSKDFYFILKLKCTFYT